MRGVFVTIDESTYEWAAQVTASRDDADSLTGDITDLQHHLNDLVHTIGDLDTVRFDDDTEDYEILEKARGLWDLVASGVRDIRNSINDVANDVNDLRRAVDFYRR